jgi:hypothetical protein
MIDYVSLDKRSFVWVQKALNNENQAFRSNVGEMRPARALPHTAKHVEAATVLITSVLTLVAPVLSLTYTALSSRPRKSGARETVGEGGRESVPQDNIDKSHSMRRRQRFNKA